MENKLNETLIDLSVDIYQKCPTLPNHPPMVLSDYQTHKTIREAEGVKFSCASMYMSMWEHTGSHVDAFNHFDPKEKTIHYYEKRKQIGHQHDLEKQIVDDLIEKGRIIRL